MTDPAPGPTAGPLVDVLVAYATAIDTKDRDLLRSVFTGDCLMDFGNGLMLRGVDELTNHMKRLHDPLDGSLHRLTNFSVALDGDQARATT